MKTKINKNNQNCYSLTSGVTLACHSLTNDSEEIRNLNQMPYLAHAQGMTNECGRSMVEMLGVLAVIGVLSVGGIAGFQVAMTNHKANEILNEGRKRAVIVSSKLLLNSKADLTHALDEFSAEDNKVAGAVFGGAEHLGEKQFKIRFGTAPSAEICDQMKKKVGTNESVDIDAGCTRLVYNNDFAVGTSGNNTNKDGNNCKEGFYGPDCEYECTGNTTPKSDGTGCECKSGYEEPGCTECASGYGKDSDDKCVACPANSANDGEEGEETNITGCYCKSGYEWDSTECKVSCSIDNLSGCDESACNDLIFSAGVSCAWYDGSNGGSAACVYLGDGGCAQDEYACGHAGNTSCSWSSKEGVSGCYEVNCPEGIGPCSGKEDGYLFYLASDGSSSGYCYEGCMYIGRVSSTGCISNKYVCGKILNTNCTWYDNWGCYGNAEGVGDFCDNASVNFLDTCGISGPYTTCHVDGDLCVSNYI